MEDQNKNLMEDEISLEERERRAREYSCGVVRRNLIRRLITVFVVIAILGLLFALLHGLFKKDDAEVPGYENTPTPTAVITPTAIAPSATPTPTNIPTPTAIPSPTPTEYPTPVVTLEQGQVYTDAWMRSKLRELYFYASMTSWETLEEKGLLKYVDAIDLCLNILDTNTEASQGYETIHDMLGKIVSQEIGCLDDKHAYSTAEMEKAAVVWCICNRVYYKKVTAEDLGATIVSVSKEPSAFAYFFDRKIYREAMDISADVLYRYILEQYYGIEDVGRVVPTEYTFFSSLGDGWHNVFRTRWEKDSTKWDWSLPDPYIAEGE